MSTLRLVTSPPDFWELDCWQDFVFTNGLATHWVLFLTTSPRCAYRLGKTAALSGEFAKQYQMIAISVDPLDKAHGTWFADINETQNTTVNDHCVADRTVANLYDMVREHDPAVTSTVRSVFIIDPQHVIPHHLHLPASTGRSDEICGC
jgi:alkyl hydroperoxide reductase subunit AhpC